MSVAVAERTGGGAGGGGELRTLLYEFTYIDGVVDFGTLIANDLVIETRITITVIFNDAAATVSIGPVSNPDSLLATNQTNPQVARDYITEQDFKAAGADSMRLKISPGTSTQGAGRALIVFRRV